MLALLRLTCKMIFDVHHRGRLLEKLILIELLFSSSNTVYRQSRYDNEKTN